MVEELVRAHRELLHPHETLADSLTVTAGRQLGYAG